MNKEGRKTNKVAGRFTKGSAPELVNSGFRMEVNDSELLYNGMSLADLAHVIMLIKIDLIPQDARRTLLNALLEMHSLPAEDIDFKMDYYNNDGTWETMCANGARCAVLYAYNCLLYTSDAADE